jgi:hypothetical protein
LPIFNPRLKINLSGFLFALWQPDKGFDSKDNHRYVRSRLKAKDAIKIGSGRPGKLNPLRKKLRRYFLKAFYRLRVKIEGCISVIKRKFKNHILTRNSRLCLLEALLMGIVYNIHRGIQLGFLFLSLLLFKRVSTELITDTTLAKT